MADRVSVSITIGGNLAAILRDQLVNVVSCEGLSTDWDGPDFDVSQFPTGDALRLYAHEVAWGRLDDLGGFCCDHHLPFVRWSGGYPGQFGPERAVFTGSDTIECYAADEEEYVVIGSVTAERLGSYDAILAHFAAAEFAVPPLRLVT